MLWNNPDPRKQQTTKIHANRNTGIHDMKQRIVIRLHLAVRAVLQSEADWRGTRLGTLTSELIHEQAAKAFYEVCGPWWAAWPK